MLDTLVTGNQMKLEAETSDDVGFDIIDIVRRNESNNSDGDYEIEIEGSNLSFNDNISSETAQVVFEYVTESDQAAPLSEENDFENFIDNLTSKQLAFVTILADDGEKISSTLLREKMGDKFDITINPRGLGGSIQGLHSKAKDALGERLTSATWLEEAGEYEYWIQDEYLDQVQAVLDT